MATLGRQLPKDHLIALVFYDVETHNDLSYLFPISWCLIQTIVITLLDLFDKYEKWIEEKKWFFK